MKTETIEGNKLIAVFMGGVVGSSTKYASGEIVIHSIHLGDKQFRDFVNETKYHSSWDWLMPVVEKIEEIDRGVFNFSVLYKRGLITSNRIDFTIKGFPKRNNISVTSTSTKEAVWLTVVEFIKWYNQ